jgi:phosphonopyruvate decarboxylase
VTARLAQRYLQESGAYLGGKRPLVVMQNSGLGVSLNALGSLHILYELPVLLLVTWRGYQGKDAPEQWRRS